MIDFLDAANQQIFKEQMARRRKGEQTTYEIEWTRKSGDKISTLVSPEALFDADGHLTGAFAAVTDITKRKRAEEATRQYTERLKILREIDQAILAVQSPEEIALATLQHIQRLVPCHRASVVEFDFDADERIVLAAHAEGETRSNMRVHVPLEMFGGLEKLHDGNVRLISDLLTLSEPAPVMQALRDEGLRSVITLPLIAQGQLIGTFNVGSGNPDDFSKEHIEIAREVADPLAVAIQQARLFEQVHAGRKRLQALSHRLWRCRRPSVATLLANSTTRLAKR